MEDRFPVWVEPDGAHAPRITVKRHKDVCLPLRTVEADNSVLRVAREGEQSCSNGSKCTACADIPGGPGVPLVAMAPSDRCILCLRLEMRAAHISHSVLGEPVYERDLVQLWESPTGPDGYDNENCMGPASTSWNGFVSPVRF